VVRLLLLGGVLLVTVVFCVAPHFHPEAVLGWRYHPALDALFHGGYFFVLTFLLYRPCGRKIGAGPLFLTLLILSILLEGVQDWVPGRSFSVYDLFANAAGITGATVMQSLRSVYGTYFNFKYPP
jgi:VanZ family protein